MRLPAPAADRAALVTGASSGIGAEIARQLAQRGHGLVLVARSLDRLETLASQLRREGVRVEVLGVDLTDRAARAALPGRVDELGLSVDVLVNNAGVATSGPVSGADPRAEVAMVELDVAAVVDLCTRFVPGMVERGRGSVLNVASLAGYLPLPGQAGYSAAKAFVLSYTRSLAAELRDSGVTVSALCPGPVDTAFGETAGLTPDELEGQLPKVLWVSAAEVARAAVDGLDRGRLVVVPGRANRAGLALTQLTPRAVLVPLLARLHPALRRPTPDP